MPCDKLFLVANTRCKGCNWDSSLYVLAETLEEANTLEAEGAGLCGNCMCDFIIETHGMVITDPKTMEFPIVTSGN